MSGIITTGNHPKALWPGVKAWWGQEYNDHQEEFSQLFDKDTSEKAYEEDVQHTGFGLAPAKAQGAGVAYDSNIQGYTTRTTHVAYALGYMVTHEEMKDNLYAQISKARAPSLARSMRQTKENVGARVYNRSTDSGYVGGDGVTLLNASHPNTSGGTFSNILATASQLNEAALEDMMIQIMGAEDDKGLLINLMPQSLVISKANWFNANRILKTTLQPGNANNDINVIKATNALPGGIIMNHYLTSPTAWYLRTNVKHGMKYYEREGISFTQDNDFDTMNAKAKAYERYSFTWTDPRALYGTAGA